jgi:hypothetical protein
MGGGVRDPMSDGETGVAPAIDREAWLRNLRRVDERQEDALAGDFDAQWGEIEPAHQAFVERFLSRLPPDGRCWTRPAGPASTSRGCWLAVAGCSGSTTPARCWPTPPPSSPRSPPPSMTSRSCPTRVSSTACGCHGVRPTGGLAGGPGAVPSGSTPGGWLYLTVELAPGDRVRAANQAARRRGLPVVEGEVIWEGPTATTITTRACSESEHGLPMPCSPSMRRPRGLARGGVRLPPCAGPPGVSWLRMSSLALGSAAIAPLEAAGLQRITWPSTFADHQGKQRSAWRSPEDC